MYVGDMIPGVTFETIENNPEAAYNKAVAELVKERASNFKRNQFSLKDVVKFLNLSSVSNSC